MDRAGRFVELLENGKIKKNILPNSSEDYTLIQEQKELEEYVRFLNSFAFDTLSECEVALYNGDEQV